MDRLKIWSEFSQLVSSVTEMLWTHRDPDQDKAITECDLVKWEKNTSSEFYMMNILGKNQTCYEGYI